MNDLAEKYNMLVKRFPYKHKYYHLNSIKNFIDNFHKIKSETDKIKCYNLLNDYLDFAIANEIISNTECRKIFYQFIEPLGFLYKKNMNYILLIQPISVTIKCVILNLIFFFMALNCFYFLGLNTLCLSLFYLIKKYMKKKNTYCYNW